MFLTREEIIELTGRKRKDAQLAALRFMGIEHRVRPDGSIAILRAHVQQEFAGYHPERGAEKRVEPNWAAI